LFDQNISDPVFERLFALEVSCLLLKVQLFSVEDEKEKHSGTILALCLSVSLRVIVSSHSYLVFVRRAEKDVFEGLFP
jgi:hypothetical protein